MDVYVGRYLLLSHFLEIWNTSCHHASITASRSPSAIRSVCSSVACGLRHSSESGRGIWHAALHYQLVAPRHVAFRASRTAACGMWHYQRVGPRHSALPASRAAALPANRTAARGITSKSGGGITSESGCGTAGCRCCQSCRRHSDADTTHAGCDSADTSTACTQRISMLPATKNRHFKLLINLN